MDSNIQFPSFNFSFDDCREMFLFKLGTASDDVGPFSPRLRIVAPVLMLVGSDNQLTTSFFQ